MKQALKLLAKQATTKNAKRLIPYLGIFAFAGCSTHALQDFFNTKANTPSAWYSIAAWLVELFSALIIGEAAQQARIATASIGRGMKKEQRRMGLVLAIAFLVLAIPTITVSFIANSQEFGEDKWLGSLFPSLCVACAIASVLPDIAKAKAVPVVSEGEEPPAKPTRPKRTELFARCACGWQGGPYQAERSRTNAKNAHRRCGCKEEWRE